MLTLAASVAALALAAPGAGASVVKLDGVSYVTKDVILKPGKPTTFKALCPAKTNVLGGGHYNSGLFGDVIGAHSYPVDSSDKNRRPDDGWAAQLRGFTMNYPAVVYAICSKLRPEYDSRVVSVQAGPGSASVGSAVSCENTALDVISGGTRGPAAVREVSSYPVSPSGPDRWDTFLANHSTEEKDVERFIICAGIDTTRVSAQGTGQPSTQTKVDSLDCPPEKPRVIGGGFSMSGDDEYDTAIAATRPDLAWSSWEAWVDNYTNSGDTAGLRVHAVCSAAL